MRDTTSRKMVARHCVSGEWDQVTCHICPHLCVVAPSRIGLCGVRSNRNGILYADSYGKIGPSQLVPSHALPLYHYRPSAQWLLVSMRGCLMRCPFCNTAQASQTGSVRSESVVPDELVKRAHEARAGGIAFGVNEPAIAHEYVVDVFRKARAAGLDTHLATSGSWMPGPFAEALDQTTALTVGLKGFDGDFLRQDCGGHLEVILENIETAIKERRAIEITYLVIEAHEDFLDQAERFAAWLAGVNHRVPVVLLAQEPAYLWESVKTSRDALLEARRILRRKVAHVYIDDAQAHQETACTRCGQVLMRRGPQGLAVMEMPHGRCPNCNTPAPFVL